jgi:hypothetical protein
VEGVWYGAATTDCRSSCGEEWAVGRKIIVKRAGEYVPYLPYGGTEGHADNDTSVHRPGVRGDNQRMVLALLAEAGAEGLTWAEIGDHGPISGCLSVLHDGGFVQPLTATRGGRAIYVLPEHVNGRATRKRGTVAAQRVLEEAASLFRQGRTDEGVALVLRHTITKKFRKGTS